MSATAGGGSGGAGGDAGGNGRAVVLGIVLLVVGAVAVVVLRSGTPTGEAYAVDSDAPDGLSALAELARAEGAEVVGVGIDEVAAQPGAPGTAVFVTAPTLATEVQLAALDGAAAAGSRLVLGGAPELGTPGVLEVVDPRSLAEVPAQSTPRGRCDIASLEDLTAIDTAFAPSIPTEGWERSCFGAGGDAYVVERTAGSGTVGSGTAGSGTVVAVGATELFVNARLQPAKEDGGEALDNAAAGLAVLGVRGGTTTRVLVVDTRPATGLDAVGAQSPLALLPVRVQLALVQLIGAFLLYLWWRTRRLGRPVRERVPVEIAGSELVTAVGDLLRRKGSPPPAAEALRIDARRRLAAATGVGPGAPPAALVGVVASRTGRRPEDVAAVLGDAPVATTEQLLELARALDHLLADAGAARPARSAPVRPAPQEATP